MTAPNHCKSSLTDDLNTASGIEAARASARRPAPFSIRLSADERAYLQERAGSQPLGAYIRDVLLGENALPRRKSRRPSIDEQQLAEVMAELGRSRLSSNLNQLAKSVNIGTLDVSEDVEAQLLDACGAVIALRDALYLALGLRAGSGSG